MAEKPARQCRTLIVEDDPSSGRTLRRLVESAGHHALLATTLAEALAMLPLHRPRCLLQDLMLTDGLGTQLLRHVRDQRLGVRVAITTGASDPRLLEEASALAPDLMLTKPLQLNRVLEFLNAG